MADEIPDGLLPDFDFDGDSEVIDFGPSRFDDERPELPELPEQARGDIDWESIRRGIETAGLAAKTAAELYRTITVAVTKQDPFAGIKIDIPTGRETAPKQKSELDHLRSLAK